MSVYRKTDRQMPARVTLAEPITVAKWWKNRAHDEIRLELSTYEGTNILNLRTWHTSKSDGITRPGKGFACSVKHLPKLAEIFATATSRARELRLIDDDGAGE
jgi:hypothetical protein